VKIENSEDLNPTYKRLKDKVGLDLYMFNYYCGYLNKNRSKNKFQTSQSRSHNTDKLPSNMELALREMKFFDLYKLKYSESKNAPQHKYKI